MSVIMMKDGEEDLFANVRPPSHKVVKVYEGVHHLIDLVTHDIRPEENQKLIIVVEGSTDYTSIKTVLRKLNEFLEDPVRKRFFIPAHQGLNIHITVIEEIEKVEADEEE